MASITTPEGILARNCGSTTYGWREPFYGEANATRQSLFQPAGAAGIVARAAYIDPRPGSLESGVTSYILTKFEAHCTIATPLLLAELIDFGSINLATNTFTDGTVMPTRTVLGASTQIPSYILAEVEAATNAAPGAITITYKNQAGTAGRSTGALNLVAGTASVAPLDFQTGTNLTTAAAGSMEFDGTVPYFSIAASTRGADLASSQWLTQDFLWRFVVFFACALMRIISDNRWVIGVGFLSLMVINPTGGTSTGTSRFTTWTSPRSEKC